MATFSELLARLRQRYTELERRRDYLMSAVAVLDDLIKAVERMANLDEPAARLVAEALLADPAAVLQPAVKAEAGEVGPRVRPPRDDGKKPYGIAPVALRVLRAVFGPNTDPPATLEKALEGIYGGDWETRRIVQQMAGPSRIVPITLGEDLSRGKQSILRRDLARGAGRLRNLHRGEIPQGYRPSSTLIGLSRVIDVGSRWETVAATLGNWGIRLELG